MRRVFWRAGFGATAEEAATWSRRGRRATLDWLVYGDGRPAELVGPAPSADGRALDPVNEPRHDVLWWLDRMVRSTRPLEEKMTLFWHDHFATRERPTPLMLRQNETFRKHALGSFPALLADITVDPAMASFLSLVNSHKDAPNENYARELLELFTIGSGYTEDDVREAARALTGYVRVRSNGQTVDVAFDESRHDTGAKTFLGHTGAWRPEHVLDICLNHPNHGPFLIDKLWAFFVGTPIPTGMRNSLVRTYMQSGLQIAPVVRRILDHPHLYAKLHKPDMIKWPAVLVAGQLRTMGAPVDRRKWAKLLSSMGQTLYSPPSVAGWDWGSRWVSSNAMRVRFSAANLLVGKGGPARVRRGSVDPDLRTDQHIRLAKRAVGDPMITGATREALERLVRSFESLPEARSKSKKARRRNAETLQRALRHLLISGPDNQLC